MRFAFFGGTFDPPHRGHVAIARAARKALRLDEVWFVPVGQQPLRDAPGAGYVDRCAMTRLAIRGAREFRLSRLDQPREDQQPNYTADTLAIIRSHLRKRDELYLILGADSLLSLPRWHRPAEIPFLAHIVAAARPGFALRDLPACMPEGVRMVAAEPQHSPRLLTFTLRGPMDEPGRLSLLPDLDEDISATGIRAALAEGSRTERLLDPAVARYIEQKQLYR